MVPVPEIFLLRLPDMRKEPELVKLPEISDISEVKTPVLSIIVLLAIEAELVTVPAMWVVPAPEIAEARVPSLR